MISKFQYLHWTRNNKHASLCGGFCAFDWKESRHICWGFLFSFCPPNWCHKSILLIINPQGHERGGPCQNIKISSWACHSLSLSYIDYLGSRLCRLDYIKCILANFLQPKNWFKIETYIIFQKFLNMNFINWYGIWDPWSKFSLTSSNMMKYCWKSSWWTAHESW